MKWKRLNKLVGCLSFIALLAAGSANAVTTIENENFHSQTFVTGRNPDTIISTLAPDFYEDVKIEATEPINQTVYSYFKEQYDDIIQNSYVARYIDRFFGYNWSRGTIMYPNESHTGRIGYCDPNLVENLSFSANANNIFSTYILSNNNTVLQPYNISKLYSQTSTYQAFDNTKPGTFTVSSSYYKDIYNAFWDSLEYNNLLSADIPVYIDTHQRVQYTDYIQLFNPNTVLNQYMYKPGEDDYLKDLPLIRSYHIYEGDVSADYSINEQNNTLYNYIDNRLKSITTNHANSFRSNANYTQYYLSDIVGGGIVLKGCTSSASMSLSSQYTIESGTYTGAPAVTGYPNIKKGILRNSGGTKSQYTVDIDSYEEISKQGDYEVVMIREINPPVIIDWDDFPIDDILNGLDLAAPVITVTREPSSTLEPTDKVTLTIKATDPNGHDHATPISINGGDYVASPATYVVTENQAVSIVAQDTFGNVREMVVNINNIDTEVPTITNISQNTDKWTRDSVKLTVTAQDDVKLHNTSAYHYQFTPNNKSVQSIDSGWVASRFFTVPDAGTVTVTVRDSLGKESTPEVYNVVNIDKIAPTATYKVTPSDEKVSTKDGVLVSLSFVDTADSVTNESSGMHTAAVRWDSASPWEENTEKQFYENGVYNVQVRDAVGNISEPIQITINNISTSKPVINSFTRDKTDSGYVTAPVTLTVNASATSGLHERPYSWDGGQTWTSVNSLKVYENKEYGVLVRDSAGNTEEAYISVLNIDSIKPTGSIYMIKGAPADDPTALPEDWIWKLRIEATDLGSGIKNITTMWDSQSYTSIPIIYELSEPGTYGVTITDNAGNQTYVEKIVTEESLGGGSGNDEYVGITIPDGGAAADPFNCNVGDLVYSKDGAYNKKTETFTPYNPNEKGIKLEFNVSSKTGRYVTGTATFNNMDYTVLFNGNEEVAKGKNNIPASVFIPIEGLTTDINNGNIQIVIKEYKDSSLTEHVRDGAEQLFTSVQISAPTIMYTYDSIADKLTLSAVSTVAGIKNITYDIGSGTQVYTEPISIGNASSVTMTATDNVNGTATLTRTAEELELNGGGGGSLPTEAGDGTVNVFYQSSKSYESYIIGGPKTNTDNLPSSSVFESLLN